MPLDSLRDESASRAYFKRHGIKKLLTDLTEGIFIDRPTQPLSYLRERIDARIMTTAALQEPTTRATSPKQAPGHGIPRPSSLRLTRTSPGTFLPRSGLKRAR